MFSNQPLLIATASLIAAMSLPSEALAQRGGRGRAVVRPIVVAPFYYAPLYSPFFWDAYAWGQPGWYGPGLFNGGFADSAARIQVTPRHAEVYVDGYLAGVVDDFDGFAQRLRLPAGEHVIELYLEGYKVIAQKILFQPGHTIRIRHTMEPIAPGDPPPNRPRPDPNAPPPSQRGGYDALGRGVPPEARSTKDASALAIRVQPGDAIVLVDGERWQTSGGERLEIQVTPGEHRIEVQKDGYQSFATTVRVRSGETAPVNVSLTKS